MINKKRLVDNYIELAKISSSSLNERKLIDSLKRRLLALGASVKEDNAAENIGGNAGNIIAEFPPVKGINKNYILLSAHTDRLYSGKINRPASYYLVKEGTTIPGGDDLAGIVIIMELLSILEEKKLAYPGIKIIFTVAEEAGFLGAKNLNPAELKGINYGLIFDADLAVGSVISRAPGLVRLKIVIEADERLDILKIISNILSEIKLGRLNNQITTWLEVKDGNFGDDRIELIGGLMGFPEQQLLQELEIMKKYLSRKTDKYGGRIYFEVEHLCYDYKLDLNEEIFNILELAAGDLNLQLKYCTGDGGSDASIYNRLGIMTLNLGLGLEHVHSSQERVKIKAMIRNVEFVLKIIGKLGKYNNV